MICSPTEEKWYTALLTQIRYILIPLTPLILLTPFSSSVPHLTGNCYVTPVKLTVKATFITQNSELALPRHLILQFLEQLGPNSRHSIEICQGGKRRFLTSRDDAFG